MANKPVFTILDNGRPMKYMTLNEDGELEPFFKIKKTETQGKWLMREPPETVDLFQEGPKHKGKYVLSSELDEIMENEEYTKTLTNGAWLYVMDTGDMYLWDVEGKQWHAQ